jgi:hypothetical protein
MSRTSARPSRFIRQIAFGCALLLVLGATSAVFAQATAPYQRTTIVFSGGTPAANGTALLNAVAAITTASSTNPWLIKVEPGIYDLGTSELQMKTFVDIEGSGRNATFIQKTASLTVNSTVVRVPAGVDAELRNLTVVSQVSGVGTGILNASTEFKLTRVNIEVDSFSDATGFLSTAGNPRLSQVFPRVNSTSGEAVGVDIQAGGPVINEMFIFILDSSTTANVGMRLSGGASPIVEGVSAVITGGPRNIGIEVLDSSTPRITNVRITVSGGNTAYGIAVDGAEADIQEVTLSAENDEEAIGLYNNVSSVFVGNSVLRAAGPGKSYALLARGGFSSSTRVNQSTLEGEIAALRVQTPATAVAIGATQLSGPVINPASAIPVCVYAYNASYAPLGANCL